MIDLVFGMLLLVYYVETFSYLFYWRCMHRLTMLLCILCILCRPTYFWIVCIVMSISDVTCVGCL